MIDNQFRVLVVDDETEYREEFKLLLEENNFIVETAIDGEEGLQKLLTDEFDVDVF